MEIRRVTGGADGPPALIFDLDGTLIDSLPDLHATVDRMLLAEGLEPMPLAEVRGYVGDGAPTLIARVMAARGIPAGRHGQLVDRFLADYTPRAAEMTRPYPRVPETLAVLRRDGHRLGICTNKPAAPTLAVLDALKLREFFSVVIAGDTLADRKPHPAPLLAALEGHTARGMFVGDSEVDARTAEAAGTPFLLFTGGYLRAARDSLKIAAAFDDFSELPALVRRIAGDRIETP